MTNFLAQAAAAEKMMVDFDNTLRQQGFVRVGPDEWVKGEVTQLDLAKIEERVAATLAGKMEGQ